MPELLFHFSEDASIRLFEPRVAPSDSVQQRVVWCVDAEHAYLYLFPRDCPRVTFYAVDTTTAADRQRFLGLSTAQCIAAIEAAWLPAMRETKLCRYILPADGFELFDEGAGYWTNRDPIAPLSVEPVGDLIEALTSAGVELRIVPSLWPLYEAVIASTLQFSIIRWRNAALRPVGVEVAST